MSRGILFLCVANSARSQLAEALGHKILGAKFEIQSAGSQPSGKVHSIAIEVLKEEGIDISRAASKSIEDLPEDFLQNLDFVITLCAEEICPYLPGKALRLHWPLQDPAAAPATAQLEAFREAKEIIKTKLLSFKAQI